MAETHLPTSHTLNGPSRPSASSLHIGDQDEGVELQPIPPNTEVISHHDEGVEVQPIPPNTEVISHQDEGVEAQPIPPNTEEDSEHKFPIDLYRQQGSLWVMPMREREMLFEKSQNPIHILECWKYDATSELPLSPISEIKEIKEDEVEAWVSAEIPTKEGLKPVAGYKILQMDSPPGDIFPLNSKVYQALIEGFKLPAIELHTGSSEQGACGVFRDDDEGFGALRPFPVTCLCSQNSTVLINRRPNINVNVSTLFRFDSRTNITYGYIITDNGFYETPTFDFTFLPTQFLACPHPILLSIIFIEQTLSTRVADISFVAKDLEDIEQVTGFTSHVGEKPGDLRLQDIVRKLGRQHAYYSSIQTSLLTFKLSIATFKRELDYMDSEGFPKAVGVDFPRHVRRLRDRIKYLESTLEHTLLGGNIQTRLQAQQQVVFNLIAQEDTKINIGLAKDSREIAAASKQDSSAMKIIAMLTTLFLPGTFIAVSLPVHYLLAIDALIRNANSQS